VFFYGNGGHGSSLIFIVIIAVAFGMRMIGSRRRQGSRGGNRMSQGSPGAPAAFVGTRAPSAPPKSSYAGYTGIPAWWMPDPSGKHHERYWSGSEWTDHVTDGGTPSVDPLPAGGPSRTEAEHPSDDTDE